MKHIALHALILGMAMGFVAQDRIVEQGAPSSLFEVLVYDSMPDITKAQEI